MLHPKLQAQISEHLDKKTDADNIARLFKKISETYYSYEQQLSTIVENPLPVELVNYTI